MMGKIEKEASNFEKKYRTTTYEKSAHVIGAKWMRDKIQGGNQCHLQNFL